MDEFDNCGEIYSKEEYLKKCMSFEPLKNYEREKWEYVCNYNTVESLLKFCSEDIDSQYKNVCINLLNLVEEDTLSCDNGLIIDGNYVLYAKKDNTNPLLDTLVNIIRVNSADFVDSCINESPKKEEEDLVCINESPKKEEESDCIII